MCEALKHGKGLIGGSRETGTATEAPGRGEQIGLARRPGWCQEGVPSE